MCGRFYTNIEREEMQNIIDTINRTIKQREELEKMKTGEIFPTNITPVYVSAPDGPTPMLMSWGFPGYPKPGSKAKPPVIINARSETVSVKPSFSRFLGQRCLVPAHAYFEWASNAILPNGKKPKFSFRPDGEPDAMFWMSAIYRQLDSSSVPVFTILTMDACDAVAPIHDRMPVILGSKDARRAWMRGEMDLTGLFRDEAVRSIVHEQCGEQQMQLGV